MLVIALPIPRNSPCDILTVEAAVRRETRMVCQALLNHPLVGDVDVIEKLVPEMLEAHGLDYA